MTDTSGGATATYQPNNNGTATVTVTSLPPHQMYRTTQTDGEGGEETGEEGGSEEGGGGSYRWIASSSSSVTFDVADGMEGSEGEAEVSIDLYQPTVSISGGGITSEDSLTPITFTVTRDLPSGYAGTGAGDDPVPDTTVNVTRGGTADSGDDYTSDLPVGMTATLENNAASKIFSIAPILDNIVEPTETIVLTANAGEGYTIGSAVSATTTLIDAGEMTVETKTSSLADPNGTHNAFVTNTATASTGFRVDFTTLNSSGQPIASTGVEDQSFVITVEGNASLSSVSDSLSRVWTVSGSTATLTIEGPVTASSFDVAVSLAVNGPGVIKVTLEAEATRGAATFALTSSSEGRAIAPTANPGPLMASTRVYHIVDTNGVGHSAALISAVNGIAYYSYSTNGLVTVQFYNNEADALAAAKAAGYDNYQYWNVTAQQAAAARHAANAFHGTEYFLLDHNCWDMVGAALSASQANFTDNGAAPTGNFEANEDNADESDVIP